MEEIDTINSTLYNYSEELNEKKESISVLQEEKSKH